MNDLQYQGEQFGMDGNETAQGIPERQHPLAHRQVGDNVVNQTGGCLGHAPCAARGANAAPLLGKRHQFLLGATVAVQAHALRQRRHDDLELDLGQQLFPYLTMVEGVKLNNRLRECLGWRTPNEVWAEMVKKALH